MKRLPIKAAKDLARAYGLAQVILCAWDGERTHVVTFGESLEDCDQAAQGGNRIKAALGWPKVLHAQPSRVRRLYAKVRACREAIKGLLADGRTPAMKAEAERALEGSRSEPQWTDEDLWGLARQIEAGGFQGRDLFVALRSVRDLRQ